MADRWLVIGLGNPGPDYEKTRHNIGHLVVDSLSGGQKFTAHKSRMDISEVKCGNEILVLAKSRGFMNETGGPAKALIDFYKIPIEKTIVIHDELDLPFKNLRLKLGGGDNGHNGLKSLTSSLSTADYYRIRMGIGRWCSMAWIKLKPLLILKSSQPVFRRPAATPFIVKSNARARSGSTSF